MSWCEPSKKKPKASPNLLSPRAIRDRINGFHKD